MSGPFSVPGRAAGGAPYDAPMPVPVVLVHGLRTSRTMWRAQGEALDRAGHPWTAVDLPGHGARLAEPFSLPAARAVLDDAAAALGGRVAVVGLSLGGYVALDWAARTDLVDRVVAAGCSTSPDHPLRRPWLALARVILRTPDRGSVLNDAMARAWIPPAGIADLAAGGYAFEVMVPALTEVAGADPIADLRTLAARGVPVHLINGRWDHFRMHERRFRAAHPGATLTIVPGATHLVSLVRPIAFNRALLTALA